MQNEFIIVVPFRNRAQHLAQFLKHYRRLFPTAYFFIVEQSISKLFNKAKLLNIGFLENRSRFDYFIFHDVDMLVQGKPDYSYPDSPTLLATNASQFNWVLPYPNYFGGVITFNNGDYLKCNGHSNNFWGWAGEDDCMYYTVIANNLQLIHRPHRYLSLPHAKSHPTGYDPVKMEQAKAPRRPDDGLNNCEYSIVGERTIPQGRIITVDI
jgi:hypothetical protein